MKQEPAPPYTMNLVQDWKGEDRRTPEQTNAWTILSGLWKIISR